MRLLHKTLLLAAVMAAAPAAFGSGHGPVFTFATPVNSRGEWSFDFGTSFRNSTFGTEAGTRTMISYGFTPHLQWSVVLPGVLNSSPSAPNRTMGMGDFESNLAWRFHRNATAVGKRFESTVSAGVVLPGQRGEGMMGMLRRAPGVSLTLASGMASRSHYVWFGGGYTYYGEKRGDQRPDVFSYSATWGYRPPAWRKKDYPAWDWRLFAELSGEAWSHAEHLGVTMPNTQGHQIFLGPTTLGIYKSFAISGGLQFPIYREVGSAYPRERVRAAINLSYFLFTHDHQKGD